MITIIVDESKNDSCGLSPSYVYKKLCEEYIDRLKNEYNCDFWGMYSSCDTTAKELYSHIICRKPNVKSLIITYKDAENCFKLFKKFADVWVYQMSIYNNLKKRG